MNTQFRTRTVGIRVAALGALALLAGSTSLIVLGGSAGATSGSTIVTCRGAEDDDGAVVSEAVGPISTASAVSLGGQRMPDPAPMSYTVDGLPESTSVGAALSAAFLWGGDTHTTNALAGPFSSFFGLTTANANPIVTSLEITGPATKTGLTVTTSSSIPLDGTDTPIPLWMPGTVTPTATGTFSVHGQQRVTYVINKDIDFQGIAVRVNTLTFVCTTEVLATVYVIAPGAPIARVDDFSGDVVIDTSGAVSGATTLDVLSNDSPTASAIDPSTLTVTNPGPFTAEVVDGMIVLTGGPDDPTWETTGPPDQCQPISTSAYPAASADDATSSDSSGGSSVPTTVVDATGGEVTLQTYQTVWSCTAIVEYSICTVDQPPICSTSQAYVKYTKTNEYQTSDSSWYDVEETLAVGSARPAVPVAVTPSYTG